MFWRRTRPARAELRAELCRGKQRRFQPVRQTLTQLQVERLPSVRQDCATQARHQGLQVVDVVDREPAYALRVADAEQVMDVAERLALAGEARAAWLERPLRVLHGRTHGFEHPLEGVCP